MKKIFIVILSILFSFGLTAQEIYLTDIPAPIFVNNGKTNFDSIFVDVDIRNQVKSIYDRGILFHDYTLEVHPNSNFETYWSVFDKRWFAVDFNHDGQLELLMIGKNSAMDEKEFIEIWVLNEQDVYEKQFAEVGKPLAYKIQPNTGELVLFHHRYPCCYSASHNIFELRLIRGKIRQRDRYFIGRDDGEMVGPFFPDEVNYSSETLYLSEVTPIYWSPAVIKKNAFPNYAETNLIIHYNKGSVYKELYRSNGWAFILLFSGIMEEQSMVINALNFQNRPVYGWIQV